ncbi:radical SAM protein [Aquihabitans sp. McL0605]|uniref:radical SAM protein n=1 Tax=Aquihabitans sp. McL0605 TaxID=3415671 RepID=UPI003CEE6D02
MTEVASDAAGVLDRFLRRPQVNHILHGFPPVRLWDDPPPAAPSRAAAARPSSASPDLALDLYVGVPFCIKTDPDRCGYCLFPTEEFERSSQVEAYLHLLDREAEQWAGAFAHRSIRSVYIGGGTPNLLRSDQYQPLMDIIRRHLPNLPGPDAITLEGIPQLFNRQKLAAAAGAGIGRISMGAQQLDPDLSALSGRHQTAEQVFDAVEGAHELGLACNVDLIFGWPRQTIDTMLRDLEVLASTTVDHITHYELNIGGPTAFSLERRHELPPPSTTEAMHLEASRALRSWGFDQLTSYDFERRSSAPRATYVYEECDRDFELHEVRGWGQAAITELIDPDGTTGWSLMNARSLGAYQQSMDHDGGSVERAVRREAVDLRLMALHRSVQGLHVDGTRYREAFGIGLDEHDEAWAALEAKGLIERDHASIRLTERGAYFVPTIQAVLGEPRLRQLKDRRWQADGASRGGAQGETRSPVTLRPRR